MAAITQTVLLEQVDAVGRTVYTTTSIVPTADRLTLCFISATDDGFTGPIVVNSVTGAGMTWVEIAEIQFDTIASPRHFFTCYRALDASPSSGALTITLDGPAFACHWIIVDFANVDTGGTNGSEAVVQVKTNVTDSGTTIAAAMDTFENGENALVGGFESGESGVTNWTAGTGFTELDQSVFGTDRVMMVEFRANVGVRAIDATADSTAKLAAIGLELRNATPGTDVFQSLLLADKDETDLTVYTTASIDPGANKLVLCLVYGADLGFTEEIIVSTITGAGLTWVKVQEVTFNTIAGPREFLSVFRALGPSPSAGALTVTLDRAAGECGWTIAEFGGVDTSGTNGSGTVFQNATNSSDSATTITGTLAAFENSVNATVGCFAVDGSNTWTVGTGFTKVAELDSSMSTLMEFRNDNDTTVDATISGGASDIAVIALEIKSANPPSGSITTNLLLAAGDAVDRTVYTTASISPTPGRLILACIMCADQGFTAAITTSTVTGAGLTWVEVNEIGFDTTVSERRGFSIWRGLGPGATAGALTITLDGPGTAARWTIIEFTDCDTGGDSGANAVVQEANARSDTGTAISATLAAFADTKNSTYAYCGSGSVSTTLTEGLGFTKIGEVDLGTIKAMGQFKQSTNIFPDFTQAVDGDMAIMAVELKFLDQTTVVGTVVQHETFSETDATTYATSSWTPAANKVHLACFSGRRSTAPMSTPTLAGNGITWTAIATSSAEAGQAKMTLFRGIAASPTTGVTTFTLAETNLRGCWTFIQLNNVDTGTGGANAIVQSATATGDAVTSVAATLSAFGADLNATIEFCTGDNPSGVVFSEGLGFTKIVDLLDDSASNFNCQIVGFRVGNDLTPNFTVTGSTQPMHMIGVELKFLADVIPEGGGAHGRLGFFF